MASHLSAHQYPSPGSSLPILSSLPKYSQLYSLSPKTRQFQTSKPRNRNPNYKPVTCQARRNDEQISPLRRDLLIGLGGLYTAASSDPFALAAPIPSPDLDHCQCDIEVREKTLDERCCLLKPKPGVPVVNFKFEDYSRKFAERPAAHLAEKDGKYYEMLEEAIEKMKSLPESDPRSFTIQSMIHCSYCSSAYLLPLDKPIIAKDGTVQKFGSFQVHDSALFFPFHRWYLYFFERICGHLIGKPDEFRLPFWNWDSPPGMEMPEFYTQDKNSSLYDVFRNTEHLPTGSSPIANLQQERIPANLQPSSQPAAKGDDQRLVNIGIMNKAMVNNSKCPRDFFGPIYRAGEAPPATGSGGKIETGPHNSIHLWTGVASEVDELNQDMGNFHTAGRDPIFYAHHANVDRMWNIWKSGEIPGPGNRRDYTDKDWLDSAFLFYDENQRMVRVKVRDSLDTVKLGYDYQKVDIPWLKRPLIKPKERAPPAQKPSPANSRTISSPVKLNQVVEFTVDRPRKKKRTSAEKAREDEVLVVQDIYAGEEGYVKFDVFINDDDYETTTPLNSQFAGSFGALERRKGKKGRGADLSLALTEILEELNAEEDESVKVTLVPRSGCRDVTFGGIKIEYNDIS